MLAEEAAAEIPNDHQNHARFLFTLSKLLPTKYTYEKQERNLSEAFKRGGDQGLEPLPLLDEDLPVDSAEEQQALFNGREAEDLAWRYDDQRDRLADLEIATKLGGSLLDMFGEGPDRISCLGEVMAYFCENNNLDKQASGLYEITTLIRVEMPQIEPEELQRLIRQYRIYGNMRELDEAINHCREALDAMGEYDEVRSGVLSNLGFFLYMRYERLGDGDDLEEAITRAGTAFDETREDDPRRILMTRTCALYQARECVRTVRLKGLKTAVELVQAAVESMPETETRTDRFGCLYNLGLWIGRSYMKTKEPLELDECITCMQMAADLAPRKHVERNACLDDLSVYLKMRHDRGKSESLADLDKAIECGREAAAGFPSHERKRAVALDHLHQALATRFRETCDLAATDELIAGLRGSIAIMTARPEE